MSSENPHITRHNYEEYFLLYVDNELSPAERMAVEAFVSSHPDLREELDILLQTTILEVPQASYGDKSSLMADSMKLNVLDDSLLLYVDDELSGKEKEKVETLISTNAEYQLQYNLLLRTKLPKEKIVYPNKAELYRKTERTTGVYWLRIAAAVIVIVAISLVYFLNGDSTSTPAVVAEVKPKTEQVVQPQQNQVASVALEENASPAQAVREEKKKEVSVPVRQQIIPQENNEQLAYDPVEPQADPVRIINTNPEVTVMQPRVLDAGEGAQHNINTTVVTEPNSNAYNSTNVVTTPAEYAFSDNEKGSSVKGLLRKATRFIEKRTGVNPVNDDDELLIGVVAIKLK